MSDGFEVEYEWPVLFFFPVFYLAGTQAAVSLHCLHSIYAIYICGHFCHNSQAGATGN